MGLDMYLTKEKYVTYLENDEKGNLKTVTDAVISVTRTYSDGTSDTVNIKTGAWDSGLFLDIPIGYWRKANHIHKWFVDNCGDGVDECQQITVSYDDLLTLKEICETIVKQEEGWEEYAKEKLPTTSGFFFGGTEYDQYYIDDCKYLINIVNELEKDEENSTQEYYYRASW